MDGEFGQRFDDQNSSASGLLTRFRELSSRDKTLLERIIRRDVEGKKDKGEGRGC